MKKCKIVIADDHPILMEGVKLLIETNESYEVVGIAYIGKELLELLKDVSADLAIIDLLLPDISGFDLIVEVKKLYPQMRILVLSGFLDDVNVDRALTAGADGIVSKAGLGNELLEAIGVLENGGTYLSNDLRYIDAICIFKNNPETAILTPREKQIVTMIAEGQTSKKIGGSLFISPRTVDTHRGNILKKLNLNNLKALIQWAFKNGFFPPR